jgi:hypothetical protein
VLDGRRIVSESGFRAILTPDVRTAGGQSALGWFVEEWYGMRLYSHPGGVAGYGTRCEFLPDQGLGWVVLTNVDDTSACSSAAARPSSADPSPSCGTRRRRVIRSCTSLLHRSSRLLRPWRASFPRDSRRAWIPRKP